MGADSCFLQIYSSDQHRLTSRSFSRFARAVCDVEQGLGGPDKCSKKPKERCSITG